MSTAVLSPDIGNRAAAAVSRIALIGNPNTGKTTLFNALCGARAKTSNFPGTTTSLRSGRAEGFGAPLDVLDLPGVYDLDVDTPEAQIARTALAGRSGPSPDAVVVIVDACNLSRNLVLVGQLLVRVPRAVLALNMADLAARRGLVVNLDALSRRLGIPVVATVARSGQGLEPLRRALDPRCGCGDHDRAVALGGSASAIPAKSEHTQRTTRAGNECA
jgi:ferrous iron transport protein B